MASFLLCGAISLVITTEVQAEANQKSDTHAIEEVNTKSKTKSEIPVVDAQRWRRGKFKFPWSQPVMVNDYFEGKYLAVLDRQKLKGGFCAEKGIVSE